jgi:hypothetical protein
MIRKHKVSEAVSVSVFRCGEENIYSAASLEKTHPDSN